MAKKILNYSEILGFEPSEYQSMIFDFVVHGQGNGVIKAKAGSGKTKTIITCMKLLPKNKKCIFLAFNESVKEEIKSKLTDYENCTIKTVHGLGYSMLSKHIGENLNMDDYKYITYLRNNLSELSEQHVGGKNSYSEYFDRIIKLTKFSRMDLAQSRKEIQNCAKIHGVELKYDEDIVAKKLMDWGKNELSCFDFTDLVWLPNELLINPIGNQYDWVFNDEAQDYSIAYVKLFQKCFKRGTRFISCGDEFQSINQFAGASPEAFNMMIDYPNTTLFDLPISYRCDKNIIKEAQRIVPSIQAKQDAGVGIVKIESKISDIENNDMVLSRTNAPLFKMYEKLINIGKPCYIKGKDNEKDTIVKFINMHKIDDNLGEAFKSDGLFPRMYKTLIEERNRVVSKGISINDAVYYPSVQSIYDKISTISVIANGCKTVSEIIEKLDNIYKKTDTGICLTTIHKAKGLESDNVHILNISDMFGKRTKTDYEIEQENNLMYVAITRAKHKLFYISDKEFPPVKIIQNNSDDALTEFNYIESCVCKLYNIQPLQPINNAEISKLKLETATKIKPLHETDNKVLLKRTETPKLGGKRSLLDNLLK